MESYRQQKYFLKQDSAALCVLILWFDQSTRFALQCAVGRFSKRCVRTSDGGHSHWGYGRPRTNPPFDPTGFVSRLQIHSLVVAFLRSGPAEFRSCPKQRHGIPLPLIFESSNVLVKGGGTQQRRQQAAPCGRWRTRMTDRRAPGCTAHWYLLPPPHCGGHSHHHQHQHHPRSLQYTLPVHCPRLCPHHHALAGASLLAGSAPLFQRGTSCRAEFREYLPTKETNNCRAVHGLQGLRCQRPTVPHPASWTGRTFDGRE